jgi:hypothetical protein
MVPHARCWSDLRLLPGSNRGITGPEPGEMIVTRLGSGPQVVNVDGPDPD